jgi:hypothetical protein
LAVELFVQIANIDFMNKLSIITITIALVLLLGYVVLQFIPTPISSDLSLLKEDKPAVVLAYENYSPSGGEALTRLKRMRSEFDSNINFIVADLGTPQGRAFAYTYRVHDSQAVLFTRKQQVVTVMGLETSDHDFQVKLRQALAR